MVRFPGVKALWERQKNGITNPISELNGVKQRHPRRPMCGLNGITLPKALLKAKETCNWLNMANLP